VFSVRIRDNMVVRIRRVMVSYDHVPGVVDTIGGGTSTRGFK